MKALTLHQPWASLVAAGAKRIETRSWSTKYRGPLSIHASRLRPGRRGNPMHGFDIAPLRYSELPLGAVVALCKLVDVVRIEVEGLTDIGVPDPSVDLRAGWKGQVWDAWRERNLGDFSVGRFAWLLAELKPVDPPIPAKGRLGLWDWERPA